MIISSRVAGVGGGRRGYEDLFFWVLLGVGGERQMGSGRGRGRKGQKLVAIKLPLYLGGGL